MRTYTYKDLLESLQKLTPEQLEQECIAMGEGTCLVNVSLETLNNNWYRFNDEFELYSDDELTPDEINESELVWEKGKIVLGGE